MTQISQQLVHRLFSYNPHSGTLKWKISPSRNVKVGDIAGCKNKFGYIQVGFNKKQYRAHRLIWLYHHGYIPEYGIDHINRIRTDNRLCNLREVSQQCNIRNSNMFNTNTSNVTGVCWCKTTEKWSSYIYILGKCKHLGRFTDFDEAVCHRLAAEQCLNWSTCNNKSSALKYYERNINGE